MKNIIETVKAFPSLSGIYIFKNKTAEILYVGKAKDLKKRVSSYFSNTARDWKIDALLSETESVEYIVTDTETEALLLEASLIQEYQPKFNVLLKSGQPFVYLMLTKDALPTFVIVRNKKAKGIYFGPFLQKQHVRKAYDFLIKSFRLLRCNKHIENGCLDYHLGICAGSCRADFDIQEYLVRVQLALHALQKDKKQFLKTVSLKITEYAHVLDFEKAKYLHEYQKNMDQLFAALQAKFSIKHYGDAIMQATIAMPTISEYAQTAQELKELLGLAIAPQTIDCFDISHFQSNQLVGSSVRFTQGKPDRAQFRKFKIKTLTVQNDYAALQEIVSRRYKDQADLPDIVLIDGGKGQRNAIVPLLPHTECISLAKKEELLFSNKHPQGIALDVKTNVGKLCIALRDYAHHFAITYHRFLRHKQIER